MDSLRVAIGRARELDVGPDVNTLARMVVTASLLLWWTFRPGLTTSGGRLVLLGLFVLIGIDLVSSVLRRGGLRRFSGAVALVLILPILLSALRSEVPRLALEVSLVPLLLVVLFLQGANGTLPRKYTLAAVGAVSLIVGLMTLTSGVLAVTHWIGAYKSVVPGAGLAESLPVELPRASPFGLHPNHAGSVIALGLPIFVAMCLTANLRMRWMSGMAIALLGVSLLMTGSRGAAVAAAVATVLVAVFLRRREASRRFKWILAAALALVGTTVFVIRPGRVLRSSLGDRLEAFSAGWAMFLDAPLTGQGPGAFPRLIDEYLPAFGGLAGRLVWQHSHNVYIQWGLEVGLVGLLGAAVAGLAAARAVKRLRSIALAEVAAIGGLVSAVAIHGLVDLIGFSLGIGGMIAMAIGSLFSSESPVSRYHGIGGGAVAALVLMIPCGLIAYGHLGFQRYESGNRAFEIGDLSRAESLFRHAAELDGMPAYPRAARLAALRQEATPMPVSGTPSRWHLGVDLLNAVTVGYADASVLDLVESMVRSDEAALVQLAYLHDRAGDVQAADGSLTEAVRLNPELASSPLWEHFRDGPARRNAVLDRLAREVPCGWPGAFVWSGWDSQEVFEEAVRVCPPGSGSRLASHLGMSNWVSLEAEATEVLEQHPNDRAARLYIGMAAQHQGRIADARRHLTTAALLGNERAAVALVDTYEGIATPAVVELVRRYAKPSSPVSIGRQGPVHRLGFLRSVIVDLRPSRVPPLLPGPWEDAVTGIDLDLDRITALETS